MRRLMIILGFVCNSLQSQTIISGGNVSGVWSLSGSPYLINGSIQILNGDSLSIHSGVQLIFNGPFKLNVQGKLTAVGSPADSISFTASDTVVGWRGIKFDNTPQTNDTSRLSYCNITYSKAVGLPNDDKGGALYINNYSNLIVSNCRISKCVSSKAGGAVYCFGDVIIKDCDISFNKALGGDGGGVWIVSSQILANSIIANNSSSNLGGGLAGGGALHLIGNSFMGNFSATGQGVALASNGTYEIKSNSFFKNSLYVSGGIISADIIDNTFDSCGLYLHSTAGSSKIVGNSLKAGTLSCQVSAGADLWVDSNQVVFSPGRGIVVQAASAGKAIVSRNQILNNLGGGVMLSSGPGSVKFSDNKVMNNSDTLIPGGAGGGIYLSGDSILIDRNVIAYNCAPVGGGMYLNISDAVISNNIISNNLSTDSIMSRGGGGLFCYYSSAFVSNNLIVNNECRLGHGGALNLHISSPTLVNNSICNNKVDGNGRGSLLYSNQQSSPDFKNCILFGNSSLNGKSIFLNDDASDPDFIYSDVEGGVNCLDLNANLYSGLYLNNIDSVPLFTNPTMGPGIGYNAMTADWTLLLNSACINKGDPVGTYPATDLAGNVRVIAGVIDLGPYESSSYLGIFEPSVIALQVFPNPHKGSFSLLNSSSLHAKYYVTITNMKGDVVYFKEHEEALAQINLRGQSPGIYVLKVGLEGSIVNLSTVLIE